MEKIPAWVNDPRLEDEPIRAELYSADRLEQHALTLAEQHRSGGVGATTSAGRLRRLRDHQRQLRWAHRVLSQAGAAGAANTPAAEWLLDNYHVVEEQIADVINHLPKRFYRELPKLSAGYLSGTPRVYALAWAIVAHTDSRFDEHLLQRFVRAYQQVQPLKIGELWAIPTCLRLVMLENLARLSLQIARSQIGRQAADKFADAVLMDSSRETVSLVPAGLRLPEAPTRQAYSVQFAKRVRYYVPSSALAPDAVSDLFAQLGLDVDELVQREHAKQAAANVSVRNVITSMRAIAASDWRALFEQVSLVDAQLRAHSGYEKMDFLTRDRYRKAIEELSRRSRHSEIEIAREVVTKCEGGKSLAEDHPVLDPGYYLIGKGAREFARELGYVEPIGRRLIGVWIRNGIAFYAGGITLTALSMLTVPVWITVHAGTNLVAAGVLAALGVIPALDIAVSLINRLVAALLAPRHLPRLELKAGVPSELRTFVVVPMLLTGERQARAQVRRLATHHLSNPQGDLRFALLSDWVDADVELRPEDTALLEYTRARVAALNDELGAAPDGRPRFYLFHRRRLWNPAEGRWMGWERKRGKLHEFNRLLRGETNTSYLTPTYVPEDVRYVVTLDADSRLPIGSVAKLVSIAAHPLNFPRFDAAGTRVVEGFALVQPRVTPTLPLRRERSVYQQVFSGATGIDPYAGAVSDVYQDMFGAGTYTGKGLYDIDAYERALAGRVPENSLLSHDLFESAFARCALASDVEIFEEFPSHSEVAAARSHRWVRGDWQLLPWIFGRRGRDIPVIDRWKMLDNLRRSLSAPVGMLTLIAAWSLAVHPSWIWGALVFAPLGMPGAIGVLEGLVPQHRRLSIASHLRAVGDDVVVAAGQTVVAITLLAQQAWLNADAIGRTMVRLLVTKRKLLEWVSAAQVQAGSSLALGSFSWSLRGATFIVVGAYASVVVFNPPALVAAAPMLVLWWVAPFFARHMSLPPPRRERPLSDTEMLHFRLSARRTWRFFASFVTPEDHHLPPDNFQEDPTAVVAHRSSPTNFGLYLLAAVAARDFGWIGVAELVDRLEASLASMQQLPRIKGHFYNWYDTRALRALEPRYVSTVDSGNLAAHLIALAQSCTEFKRRPHSVAEAVCGVLDTLALLRNALAEMMHDRRVTGTVAELEAGAREMMAALSTATDDAYGAIWQDAARRSELLVDLARTLVAERDEANNEALSLAQALDANIRSHLRDAELLFPWTLVQDGAGSQSDSHLGSRNPHHALPTIEEMPAYVERAGGARIAVDSSTTLPAAGALLQSAAQNAQALGARLDALAAAARRLCMEMDFRFLYDSGRGLLAIGYRVDEAALDSGYYDLLASEARLTSFVAIAKGDVPVEHWYHLGRRLTPTRAGPVLLSWSGSMFEFLMPSLVMVTPRGSLLDRSCRGAIESQIAHGARRALPWGVSESAYYVRDRDLTYQYADFGIPEIGLKRGLERNSVVAPYATALAAMYVPHKADRNFEQLRELGALGRFGWYEALDFTPGRLQANERRAVVRAYMAHHQGMSLVAFANTVFQGRMRRRFHSDLMVEAADLLLQERIPRAVTATPSRVEQAPVERQPPSEPQTRRIASPFGSFPATQILSNGHLTTMVTAAGSGFTLWNNLGITRWREDATQDCRGTFIYLRDTQSGAVWSAGYQPTRILPGDTGGGYEAMFAEDRIRIRRRDGMLTCVMDILVSPEDDAEIRTLTLTNAGTRARELEVTTYTEVVLASPAADLAHPAFSNLFVQTEYDREDNALLATRRVRSASDPAIWAAHVLMLGRGAVPGIEFETERVRFLGRGRDASAPLAVFDGRPLSNTVGAVLDPIFSLRTRVRIEPGASANVGCATLVAASRAAVLALADKYRDGAAFERVRQLAWTHAQVQLHYLRVSPEEANLFQELANRIIYIDASLRPGSAFLKLNRLNISHLWGQRISGDRPILLARVSGEEDREFVMQLLRAREYWRAKRLVVDLVLLNEKAPSYSQDIQNWLEGAARARQPLAETSVEDLGGIFVVRAELLAPDERHLLLSSARVVLSGAEGSLAEQLARRTRPSEAPLRSPRRVSADGELLLPTPTLEFFNGLGGFADDGREYVIVLNKGQRTPAPWVNVIANAGFGFLVSDVGAGFSWSHNSRENPLTPWSNDPVTDPCGEAIYIRDDDTGAVWTPTAAPIRIEEATYIVRHGQGYSRFEHRSHGVWSDLQVFADVQDPIKVSRLRLRNAAQHTRRLSVIAYVEWVLGSSRQATAPFVITEMDAESGAAFAHNPWSIDYGEHIAFLASTGPIDSWTCDRGEFLGRNGHPAEPAALATGKPLGRRSGAGLDPCASLRTTVELKPGQQLDLVFLLGQTADRAAARDLVQRFRQQDLDSAFEKVKARWEHLLTAIEVETPERSMDLMLNRWLLYQAISSRMWARTGFYQASGAFGFRDQLQDGMATVVVAPELTRAHLLRAAARQFADGDVQHWWHPPTGRGVRTHVSDDRVWLPYAVGQYVDVTGDREVLDVELDFLDGPPLEEAQESAYFEPACAGHPATLYEHCVRALEVSLEVGQHGLPLMRGGDWNDGMNRVGHQGKGESIWLAWFLHVTLTRFAEEAVRRLDGVRATRWRDHAEALRVAVEAHGWDGAWYRRAFYDDGTPLGSATGTECRIDSLAQSWAVLSGAAAPERAHRAMGAVAEYLIRDGDDLVLLFAPPFDNTPFDPGYIKGYLPGVRENGGQYTHAAAWCLFAFAKLGDGDQAGELFRMINPVNRAATRAGVYAYKVEPYVVAADVYAEASHLRRGGWTWYTGSAGWLYRAGVEAMLGLQVRAGSLHFDPCIPRHWPGFSLRYRDGETHYRVVVTNPDEVSRGIGSMELDGQPVAGGSVPRLRDGGHHMVRITLTAPGNVRPMAADGSGPAD